jgi:YHS domain-containing protein
VRILILGLLLGVTVWLLVRGLRRGMEGAPGGGQGATRALVQDPVCKTFVPKDSALVVHKGGSDHYFCGERCAEKFRSEHP